MDIYDLQKLHNELDEIANDFNFKLKENSLGKEEEEEEEEENTLLIATISEILIIIVIIIFYINR